MTDNLHEPAFHDDDGEPKIKLGTVLMLVMGLITIANMFAFWWISTTSATVSSHGEQIAVIATNQKAVMTTIPEVRAAIDRLTCTTAGLQTQLAVNQATQDKSGKR